MGRIIADYDEFTGVTECYQKDINGNITIARSQDVGSVLDANKVSQNAASEGWKGELHHTARIPLVTWEQWWREFGSDPGSKENRVRLKRKLNSSEFQYLRTKLGRI